jgi:hypothetical protein
MSQTWGARVRDIERKKRKRKRKARVRKVKAWGFHPLKTAGRETKKALKKKVRRK